MADSVIKKMQFPEIRVVEASAGSGKTFALARRYVQLLLYSDQVSISQILAITFTNKAAFEMKSRILEFLKKIALQQLSSAEQAAIIDPLGLPPKSAAVRAYAVMDELIRNYNFFQVQTIDSFMNSLLVGCAFKLGLSANFRIRHNSSEYLSLALDELIERAPRDKAASRIFTDFLQQYLFLENRPSWFPKKDILSLVAALYQQNNFYGLDFVGYPLKEDRFEQKRKIMALMRKLNEELPEEIDGRFRESLRKFLERYTDSFDFDRLSDYFSREELPLRKNAPPAPKAERLWARIRERLTVLSEAEAGSLFNPYIEVFLAAKAIFSERARRDDALFLEELNRQAHRLFTEGEVSADELYYRLATRIHHYLLDEFQDTSRLQWNNLLPLVEEAVASGGTLFYVGDKKQAIYSFRGGEPKLFDEVGAHFSGHNVVAERLERNFRSQKAVVEFNNSVFSLDNLRRFIAQKESEDAKRNKNEAVLFEAADFVQLENVFKDCAQSWREGRDNGYVQVSYIEGANREERDGVIRERLLAAVGEIRTRYALSSIAVLARDNAEVESVTAWLMAAGIAVESERTLNIKTNGIVNELLAFLRFLESPIDNRSFVDFIAGEIFCRRSGQEQGRMHDFVFALRPRIAVEQGLYIYKEFRERFPEEWEQLFNEFFQNVGLYPLYELVTSIIERFAVLRNFPGDQGFVMRFLELIKEQEEDAGDIASFLARFEEIREEEFYVRAPGVSDEGDGPQAVRVLTVHKAKGLEFPAVIIPFLGMETRVAEGGKLGQQSYLLNFSGNHQELLRIKQKYLPYSKKLAGIYHQNYVRAFLSELNNIYVALTRAADELYVFIPNRVGNSMNAVNFLIPPEFASLGAPRKSPAGKAGEKERTTQLPNAVYHDWITYLGEEFGAETIVFDRAAAWRGDILHFLLAQIGNLSGQDEKVLITAAITAAKNAFGPQPQWREYEEQLAAILRSSNLRPFFKVENAEIFNEVEVADKNGQLRRIDRLVVFQKEVWVLDYKTYGGYREEYTAQVKGYMDILAGIYPGRKIKGFVGYLEELRLEIVGD